MPEIRERVIVVKKRAFDNSFQVPETPGIYIHQEPYHLSHAKYILLTSPDIRSKLNALARWIFGSTIGFGLIILAKLLLRIEDIQVELTAFKIGLISSAALFLVSLTQPNPKNAILKDMKVFFKEHRERLWVDREK